MSWEALQEFQSQNNFLIQSFYRQYPIYNPKYKQVVIMVEGMNYRLSKSYETGNFDVMREILAKSVLKKLPKTAILYWSKIRQFAEKNGMDVKRKMDVADEEDEETSDHYNYTIYLQVGSLMYRQNCNSGDEAELNLYKNICLELNIDMKQIEFFC